MDSNSDGNDPNKQERHELRQLKTVHGILAGTCILGLVALLFHALFGAAAGNRIQFLTWSWISAIGALVSGVALGLLFGLPNVRRVEIVNKAETGKSEPNDRNSVLGYAESTNLEQVADWLTKIIIGLTLTQYHHWEGRFTQLSYDLTCRLNGDCTVAKGTALISPGSTIPGGFLLLAYGTLGFLIAYLWMRGHFIAEMEAAKSIAIANARRDEIEKLDKELKSKQSQLDSAEAARDEFKKILDEKMIEGLGQKRGLATSTDAPAEMAEEAARRVKQDANAIAKELIKKAKTPIYPDDPWKSLFNGSPMADQITLTGKVTPNAQNPDWFDIELVVEQDPARAQPANSVQYFLHPTFGPDPRSVKFGTDGKAPLSILGYGAFTVGVLVDDGTLLELDLASLAGVGQKFLAR